MALGTPHDEMYNTLIGSVVTSTRSDQDIAVEKKHARHTDRHVVAAVLQSRGSADIATDRLPLLRKAIAHTLMPRACE